MNGLLPNYEFDEPAVVLSSIGARCGKCFFVKGKWSSLANTQVIRPDPELADAKFLWFQLNDEKRWPRSGTGQPFIKPSDVKSHRIYLPPLPEQRRIAAILDKADALRAKRREALAQLDRLAQSIFVEMFGDPVTNPKGWDVVELRELVIAGDNINYGVVQPGDDFDDGVPLIRVGDMVSGVINHDALKKISPEIESDYKRSRLVGDELLLSCVGSIGSVALVTGKEQGFNIARAVARIRLRHDVSRHFMAVQLSLPGIQSYFRQELRTVSQPTLNIKQINETMVVRPPKKVQRAFDDRIAVFGRLRESHQAASQALTDTFAALQHRAFRGEL
jgi:type I restriction enzyme S subunit